MQSTYYCPTCKAPVALGQNLCNNCGAALTWTPQQQPYYCPYCSSVVTYGRAACGVCGTTLVWEEQQTSGQQTGLNQPSQQNTGGETSAQKDGRPYKPTRKKAHAALRKQKTIAAIGLIFILIISVVMVIISISWGLSEQKSGAPALSTGEPAILSFTASPTTVAPGEKSTLKWNTGGATTVSIDQNIGKVAAAGSLEVSPSENTTYTLAATNSIGSITGSATVNVVVPPLPVISAFTASPSAVNPGQTANLQWNVTGASYITIDHGVGTVPASGSAPISPSENTTYTLTAGGRAGSVKASTTVTMAGATPPAISVFSAKPAAINIGQSSLLQWEVTGATSVSINHDVGPVDPSGSKAVSPSENTTYILTAKNDYGSISASAVVAVYLSKPPVIGSFTATPSAITAGQSSTLQWTVTGATSVSINPGIGTVDSTGTFSISPSDNTTYILTASSGGSTVTSTATISIVPTGTPIITSFNAVPGVITKGQSTELRWNVSGATSVSIDQGIGTVDLRSGTVEVSPATHTTYILTATGTAGSSTASVIVTVAPPSTLSINSFTSSPVTIRAGNQATLQWSVSGATSVTIDHGVGDSLPLQGTASVTPNVETTYTLTAIGSSNTITASVTVSVIAAGTPVIALFTASSPITAGHSTTLEWNVEDANSVHIDNGIGTVPLIGSVTTSSLSETTTYTLTAQGNSGTATSTVTVTVNPAP
ncbi:MAG: zinc ribbon domain-containing protein [Chloroflexi bacterium]|nr:zinc ribbon domain-containing protein [Chloroflexota bacterium]